MPYRVRTSANAEQDLEKIYLFIEAYTSDQAAEWFMGLREAIGTLRDMPQRFPVIREVPEIRHLLYGNRPHVYRVLFRIDEARGIVNVLNVRHRARSAYKLTRKQ